MLPSVWAENITIDNSTSIQDTVNLDFDTIKLNSGTYYQSEIKITKNITIEGNGDAHDIIIDGGHEHSIFTVDSVYSITIKNITFRNAFSDTNGGAIKITDGAYLTVENCNFINNSADSDSNEAMGGAISITGYYHAQSKLCRYGTLIISNCNFTNNYAGTDGGATNTFFSTAHITNSIFKDNSASRDGGGVSTRGSDITFIENCTFIGNRAAVAGGALKNYISEMTITNCLIINNTANQRAGAIRNCGPLNVYHSKIFNNSAKYTTGVLEVYLEKEVVKPSVVFNYNEILDNYAPEASFAYFFPKALGDHDFEYNYWRNVTLNSEKWNETFITNGVCENPINQLKLVSSTITASNMTRGYNSTYDFKAQFLDKYGIRLKNMEINFKINNTQYITKTDENGYAYLNLKLNIGKYIITSVNPSTNEELINQINIVKRITQNSDLK